MSEVQAEKPKGPDWEQFVSRVEFRAAPEFRAIYVIKHKKGGYLRIPSVSDVPLCVRDRRMATRFDSHVWARTLLGCLKDAKIVRLVSSSERELRSLSCKTWVRGSDPAIATPLASTEQGKEG